MTRGAGIYQERARAGHRRITRKIGMTSDKAEVIDRWAGAGAEGFSKFAVGALLARCEQLKAERYDQQHALPVTVDVITHDLIHQAAVRAGKTDGEFLERWVDLDKLLIWVVAWSEGTAVDLPFDQIFGSQKRASARTYREAA